MARPHTEFIHAQSLNWQTGVLPGPLAEIECKVLSMDDESGACSLIVRYPKGWTQSGAVHLEGAHEFLVLDGSMEIAGQQYPFDSYAYLPAGYTHDRWSAPNGAVALTFFSHRPNAVDGAGNMTGDAFPYLYLHDMDWSTEGVDPDLDFLRIAHKRLRHDEEKGDTTLILNSGAQTHPRNWEDGALAHPCVEEMFLLSGDIITERGFMNAGAYFWRPPNIWHGPFGSRNGHLCVIRFLDGHHVNNWSEEKYPFSLTPEYKPDLPDSLRAQPKTKLSDFSLLCFFRVANLEEVMPWTEITRPDYDRRGLRYASDVTDAEWALIQHFMPERAKTGRPRRTCMRSVWNAIQYIAATGCQWSMLPKEFPPFTTVQYYFYQMRDSGVLDILNDALVAAARMLTGREATPTAGIIDSQSVKTTESGGPRGYDAGKKTKGRKRHIVTDTDGNLLGLITHAADIQDRDGASVVIAQALENHSSLTHIFADGGYSGDKLRDAMASIDGPTIEIVKRPPGVTGFVVIARRWVVERTFAWLGRCRRLAKDWEKTIASADAWTLIAAIRRSARLIARKTAQEF